MFQTNNVFRVYNVAAILWSQFMVHGILFLMVNVLYFTLVLYYYYYRIVIIIIIIIIIISFMQDIYKYISETNHVAAILSLLFMVPISPVPALALSYF
jgi:hypothetical protein